MTQQNSLAAAHWVHENTHGSAPLNHDKEILLKIKNFGLLAAILITCVTAHAESSVTVFGVADVALRRISNGDLSATSLGSGGLAAGRFGIRSTEDLGGGMSAGAWIEGTVNFDEGTGNSARLWNRRSTVSLMGSFGEIRLGHELTPGYTAFGEFDTFGTSGLADQGKFYGSSEAVLGSGLNTTGVWARTDNAISYYTPKDLGGYYAHVQVAAGEGVLAKKFRGGRIGYNNGALHVTGAYSVTEGLAGDFKRSTVSGSYDFKVVKVLASLTKNEYLAASRQIAQIGVHVPVSANGLVRVGYTRVNTSGSSGGTSIAGNDANQFAAGYVHTLSKRTSLYGTYARVDNKGNAGFSVATPPASVAGRTSKGIEFGISHRF